MTTNPRVVASPVGRLWLRADGSGRLTDLRVGHTPGIDGRCGGDEGTGPDEEPGPDADRTLDAAESQLDEYFARRRQSFDLPLAMAGSPFQRQVWAELLTIPFGTTVSYGDVALRLGSVGAARAIGHANARNPIAIIVPCHRVIGSSGRLTGYGGGLRAKRHLLDLEAGEPRPSSRKTRKISPRVAP